MIKTTASTIVTWLRANGPSSSVEICGGLHISQPVFSRLVQGTRADILRIGRARATRYAAVRVIDGVPSPTPIYELGPQGQAPRRLGELHPVFPNGYWFESNVAPSRFYDDLPYFLTDLRPAGFLGRLVPQLHPDLGPRDITLWTADHTLRYLCHHGWDAIGALVVGDIAYTTLLENHALTGAIPDAERALRYPELADNALQLGPAGSSAAGEQPKFLTAVAHPDRRTPVLVKFSPADQSAGSRRWADLLVAEHLVHTLLRDAGFPAAASTILCNGGRTFLEVERFDRPGGHHRLGQISAAALDAELVGSDLSSWIPTADGLLRDGHINAATHTEIRWLHRFGRWIANTDMHHGNLAFHHRGLALQGLTPTYDMLPMLYRPAANGEVIPRTFTPDTPSPADADIAHSAWTTALSTWQAIATDERITPDFQAIAAQNHRALAALEPQLSLLPTAY